MSEKWLERTSLLLGDEKLKKLQNANVLVVGLGGVGAYAAEMIARRGPYDHSRRRCGVGEQHQSPTHSLTLHSQSPKNRGYGRASARH